MNWDAAGAIAEIVGAFGVIASLLYLATQIKATSISAKVDAKLTTTGFLTQFNHNFINDPELYDVWLRANKGTQNFSREELSRFTNLNFTAGWLFSAAHYQKRVGTLEAGEWFELEAMMKYYLKNQGVTEWWQKYAASRFDPNYVEYVNQSILEGSSDAA